MKNHQTSKFVMKIFRLAMKMLTFLIKNRVYFKRLKGSLILDTRDIFLVWQRFRML